MYWQESGETRSLIHTLLVGMWIGSAALENSLAVDQKVVQSSKSSTTRHVPKRNEACLQIFTAASFIIAKKWKNVNVQGMSG